jgi:hypothetical protein
VREGVAGFQSRRFEAQSAQGPGDAWCLLLAQRDLLGRAERLAADAFGNLLDFTAGLEKCSDLAIDRFAGFDGWSWLCFAVGCFYAHGGH